MVKRSFYPVFALAVLIFLLFGCKGEKQRVGAALDSITAEDLAEDVRILSSDEYEGRFPGSLGEEKTVAFLKEEFEKIGLKPGNGESYFQEVPLVEITAEPEAELTVTRDRRSQTFALGDEFAGLTRRVVDEISLADSEMVFVGYGIVAPDFEWNDYEGVDVRGKTVVVLVNDPGFATEDPALFTGRAMTYYGRWTYKFEEAARQGAAGVFVVHETEPAAYGWGVVKKGWTGPQFYLESVDRNMSRCAVEGWLTLGTTQRIFEAAGQNYGELKASAVRREFKAVPLGVNASLTLKNTIRQARSRNVIALLPGAERSDEYIIYMAHWDHFGIDPALEGDQIYNGALDNATGTSALIELGEAFRELRKSTKRSIVFLAVTAEEQGLLGSLYYATNPIYPRTKTVAAINMDALNIYGKMRDITAIGYGNSELDSYLEVAAAEQGRVVRPDPKPEEGSFFRSDHFCFARKGIPALYPSTGIDHVEHGIEWTLARKDEYRAQHYHKPSDEYDASWDLSGAIDDLRLLFKVGYRLSNESTFPNWNEGCPYRAVRDAEMTPLAQ